jgi:hypothetical protein
MTGPGFPERGVTLTVVARPFDLSDEPRFRPIRKQSLSR